MNASEASYNAKICVPEGLLSKGLPRLGVQNRPWKGQGCSSYLTQNDPQDAIILGDISCGKEKLPGMPLCGSSPDSPPLRTALLDKGSVSRAPVPDPHSHLLGALHLVPKMHVAPPTRAITMWQKNWGRVVRL